MAKGSDAAGKASRGKVVGRWVGRLTLLLCAAAAAQGHAAEDGAVYLESEILNGPVMLDEAIRVGDREVDPTAATLIWTGRPLNATRPPMVTLMNGERWAGRILRIEQGRLLFRNSLVGERSLPVSRVAAIAFGRGAVETATPPAVVRTNGQRVPGEVVWLDDEQVGVDSALGVLPLPREQIAAVFRESPRRRHPEGDVVRLIDGSIYAGQLTLTSEAVTVDHATLGTLRFPPQAVNVIVPNREGRQWLDDPDDWSMQQIGPLGESGDEKPVTVASDAALAAFRLMPTTKAQVLLPALTSGGKLIGRVRPLGDRSRTGGAVHVRIEAGGRKLWEQQIQPGDPPQSMFVELGQAAGLTVVVEHATPFGFPAGVVIENPMILGVKE